MSLANWGEGVGLTPQNGQPYVYWESVKTDEENFTDRNSAAQRVFLVGGLYKNQFIIDLLGQDIEVTDRNGMGTGNLSRSLPDQHPGIPGFFAAEASVKPLVSEPNVVPNPFTGGVIPTFALYEITATYRPLDYAVVPDELLTGILINGEFFNNEKLRFTSRNFQFSAKYIQAGNLGFKFVSQPNNALAFQPARLSGETTLIMTWHSIPSNDEENNPFTPPMTQIASSLVGKINKSTFDGYPTGTVLFVSYEIRFMPNKIPDGLVRWDAVYTFQIKNNGAGNQNDPLNESVAGWNYLWRSDLQKWDLFTCDARPAGNGDAGSQDGGRLYQQGELNELFVLQA